VARQRLELAPGLDHRRMSSMMATTDRSGGQRTPATDPEAHLRNAAATLRAILAAKHPEYAWVVHVDLSRRPRGAA
jgi:hypothetical protein